MAVQANVQGIEKIVYKADAGDITFNGEDIILDQTNALTVERILANTAKGTERRQGNKRFEFEFKYVGSSNTAAVETDNDTVNSLEFWQLGSSSSDQSFDCDLQVLREELQSDPEGEPSGTIFRAKGVVAV